MSEPSAEPSSKPSSKAAWLSKEERGTVLGIRFVVWLCNLAGRTVARALVYVIAFYYVLFAGYGRRASRAWLTHVLGTTATLRQVYRHIATFALVTLDRVFLLQGRSELFELTSNGNEHLEALSARKQGALLLGGHIGSFEALRARAGGRGFDLYILAHAGNAKKISQVLSAVAPESELRVINAGSVSSMLRAKEVVESGAMIAILGDRVGLNNKTVEVTFMGRPAPFPTGPFLLASSLRCPVLLVFGLYLGGNRYALYCEPFADKVTLPRGDREGALREYVQAYAARLEHFAKAHPYNWFNIYDFWNPTASE